MMQSDFKRIIIEEIIKVLKEEDFDFNTDLDDSRTAGFLFTVRNDDEGKRKIQQVKDDLSDIFSFRVRGRHHDRKEILGSSWRKHSQNDVPIAKAEFLSVYVQPKV